jgi:hypothetical protein
MSKSKTFAKIVCVSFLTFTLMAAAGQAQSMIGVAPTNQPTAPSSTQPGDGGSIQYGGGPVMLGPHDVYLIWYGNWGGNTALTLLPSFVQGLNGSAYFNLATTFFDSNATHITNNVFLNGQVFDNYSQGAALTDATLESVVQGQLQAGDLPVDQNGIYLVLTSDDVGETGSLGTFCTNFCGFHTHATLQGADIKYAFIGNVDRCPGGCTFGELGPGPNNNVGADGMANMIAHELLETVTDPDGNAWGTPDTEVGDLCNFVHGNEFLAPDGAPADVTLDGLHFLIQEMLDDTTGACEMSFGTPQRLALTSWVQSDGPHFVYIDRNNRVDQVWFTVSANTWHTQSVSGMVGSPLASPGSGLTSWMQSDGPHFVYIDANGNLNQIWYTISSGAWNSQNLTGMTKSPAASVGSALTSWVQSDGPHLVYVDANNHLNQLWYTTSANTWRTQNLSSFTGASPANPQGELTSWVQSDGPHFVYVDGNNQLDQIWYTTSANTWSKQNLTSLAGIPAATPGSSLASWVEADGPHLIYIDQNQNLNHVWYTVSTNTWNNQDLSNVTGAPLANLQSRLTAWAQSDGTHVVYTDQNNQLDQLWHATGSTIWNAQNLSGFTGARLANPGGGVTSWIQSDGPHFVYIDQNGHLDQLWFTTSANTWSTQNLTSITGASNPN